MSDIPNEPEPAAPLPDEGEAQTTEIAPPPFTIDGALAEADDLLLELGRIVTRRTRFEALLKRRIRALADEGATNIATWKEREGDLRFRLKLLHQAIRDAGGGSSYTLPTGKLGSRAAKKWEWPKDDAVEALIAVLPANFTRVAVEVDKPGIAKAAVIRGAKVFLPNAEGEMVELPGVSVFQDRDWWATPGVVESDEEESDDGQGDDGTY